MALPVYQDASGRVLKLVGGKSVPFDEKPRGSALEPRRRS